jgi:hypothetical protein
MSLLMTNTRGGSPRLPHCKAQRPATTTRLPSYAHQFSCNLRERLRKLGAEHLVRDLSGGFRFGVAQHGLCAAAPKLDPSLQVDHKDRVLREFEQGSLLCGCNLLLTHFRNIAKNQHNTNDFSMTGENWGGTVLNRNFPAIPCDKIHVISDRQNLLLLEHTEYFIVRGHPGLFIDEPKNVPDWLVESLLRSPSGQSGRDGVEKGDSALAVRCYHGLANAAQSRSPSLFALQQLGAQLFDVVTSEQR